MVRRCSIPSIASFGAWKNPGGQVGRSNQCPLVLLQLFVLEFLGLSKVVPQPSVDTGYQKDQPSLQNGMVDSAL